MIQGFDLQKLCEFVQFKDEQEKTETQYEAFVKLVMDAKLHIPEKSCVDIWETDQNVETPYGIDFFIHQFWRSTFGNENVDRYIPLEEIRMALLMGIGEKCDVNRMIDTYLETEAKERNTSFEEELLVHESGQTEKKEHYDINRLDELQFYETGSTITPGIRKAIGKLIRFSEDTLKEDTYKKLMEEKTQKRKEWMIRQNRSILIRDKDWEKIFFDIETDDKSFARYYPMVRIKITDSTWEIVKALLINDELYEYSKELAEQYTDEEADSVPV